MANPHLSQYFFDNIITTKTNSLEKVISSNLDDRGNSRHFLPLVNGGKKINLELSFETQSHMNFETQSHIFKFNDSCL